METRCTCSFCFIWDMRSAAVSRPAAGARKMLPFFTA